MIMHHSSMHISKDLEVGAQPVLQARHSDVGGTHAKWCLHHHTQHLPRGVDGSEIIVNHFCLGFRLSFYSYVATSLVKTMN